MKIHLQGSGLLFLFLLCVYLNFFFSFFCFALILLFISSNKLFKVENWIERVD